MKNGNKKTTIYYKNYNKVKIIYLTYNKQILTNKESLNNQKNQELRVNKKINIYLI